jgi:hypothetical protein
MNQNRNHVPWRGARNAAQYDDNDKETDYSDRKGHQA